MVEIFTVGKGQGEWKLNQSIISLVSSVWNVPTPRHALMIPWNSCFNRKLTGSHDHVPISVPRIDMEDDLEIASTSNDYYAALVKRTVGLSDRSRSCVRRMYECVCILFWGYIEKLFSRGNWNITTCDMTMWYSGHSFEVNIGRISKIDNFHLIDLKFEEDLHIWWCDSTTNYFWGQHWPKGQDMLGFLKLSIFIWLTWN